MGTSYYPDPLKIEILVKEASGKLSVLISFKANWQVEILDNKDGGYTFPLNSPQNCDQLFVSRINISKMNISG